MHGRADVGEVAADGKAVERPRRKSAAQAGGGGEARQIGKREAFCLGQVRRRDGEGTCPRGAGGAGPLLVGFLAKLRGDAAELFFSAGHELGLGVVGVGDGVVVEGVAADDVGVVVGEHHGAGGEAALEEVGAEAEVEAVGRGVVLDLAGAGFDVGGGLHGGDSGGENEKATAGALVAPA